MRVNLLHAHGSPTMYLYRRQGCRCSLCSAVQSAYYRKWREAHRNEKAEYDRRYHAAHRDNRLVDMRRYREEHRGECRERDRRYHQSHREERSAYYQSWRESNADEKTRIDREYYRAHLDEYLAYSRNRRAREQAASGTHTAADIASQYLLQHGRCYWCNVKVGEKYHVDHVVPLSKGGSNGPENLVITCSPCNLSKGAKHPMDFAGCMV